MASEPDQHSSPASFYESPQAARHARPEEFLYLACMHEGTGVDEVPGTHILARLVRVVRFRGPRG